MKFTKEDANKELVRLMTDKGEKLNLSERSINEHLDNLMPLLANDETELNAFVQQILPLMKTADANVRHDVSVGIADFKKGYKPTTEPITKNTKNNDGEGGGGDSSNDDLLNRIAALEEKLKKSEEESKIKSIKMNFIAKAKEKGVSDEEWLKDYVDEINIGTDIDVDAKVESCLKFFNKSKAQLGGDVTPKNAGGNVDDKYMASVISQLVPKGD